MHEVRLTRDEQPIEGNVMVIAPFGKKTLPDGTTFDFDWLYTDVIGPTVTEAGMTPVRGDSVYGPASVLNVVWRAIQQAELIVVDFSCRAPNVAMEYMAAKLIGKRMIYLAQSADDIPSDVRGLRYIPYSNLYADMSHMREELRVQLQAVRQEPVQEMALIPMATKGTVPARARVVSVSREFAVVRADDGTHGVLGHDDVDWSRIVADMTRLYAVGDVLDGAFELQPTGGAKYTLIAGRPNPWQALAAGHPAGHRFTAAVHSVRDAGVFVRVTDDINGLVPRSTLPEGVEVNPGGQVDVSVVDVDVRRRRITLRLHERLPVPTPIRKQASPPGLRPGDRLEGRVHKAVPEDKGGYILLKVAGRARPVLLHCSAMSEDLRQDLNAGEVERDEVIDVEVVSVDGARDKVLVRDVPEEESDEVGDAA
ncbi:S1 RNA-binding domain-containing protein [Streptomyces sp. NPDC058794]|uniref:S1 RNA-binding domain-containing protein n=1 Tax=unclassified Streptomyces TaxID=2593676 RepID=UPI0036B03300